MSGTVLIVGATSDIGLALARAYAAEGHALILTARRPEALDPVGQDLRVRHGVSVELMAYDLLDLEPESLVDRLTVLPDTIVLVAGVLGDQAESAAGPAIAARVMETNYVAPARLLLAAASRMRARGSGTMVGISSVAGDRGRGSNFIYGSSKAGLTAFLSGLRNSLAASGVHVLTVKPGFVRTRMTEAMTLPAKLTAEPDEVARAVLAADKRRRDVIYVRPVWRVIMGVIGAIPESRFKKLKL